MSKKVLKWNPSLELSICLFCIFFPINSWQFYLLLMVNLILNLHLYLSNKNRKTHAYRSENITLCLFMLSQHPELAAYEYECIQCHMHCYTACDTVHPLSNVYSAVTVMPGSDMKCFPWQLKPCAKWGWCTLLALNRINALQVSQDTIYKVQESLAIYLSLGKQSLALPSL